jgi:cytochrome c oxidase assembly protein subunit 15
LPLEGVTQLHADIGWMLGMLVTVLVLSLKLTGAPQPVTRLSWLIFSLVFAQGAIGYAQYFSGLPAGLVWVHVADSVVIWIVALRLMFATRDRGLVTGAAAAPAGQSRPVAATPAG